MPNWRVFFSRDQLMREFRSRLETRGEVTIQEFSDILAQILFGEKTRWGDKTPDYGFYMTQLQLLWPECKFVHVVRGGLATARSLSRHPACMLMTSNGFDNWCSLSFDRIYEKYQIRSLPLDDYVAAWRRRHSRIRDEAKRLRQGTYQEIRYESLLSDTEPALREVAEHLGLEVSTDWLAACRQIVRKPTPNQRR